MQTVDSSRGVVVGFGVGGQRWMGTLYPAQLGCEPKTALTKFINPLKKKKKKGGAGVAIVAQDKGSIPGPT